MRIKFEYPLKTALRLKEHWPVTVGGVKLEWRMQGQEPIGLIASCPMAPADKLPTMIVGGPNEDVAAHVDAGRATRQDEVESIARTVQGLASLFVSIDVNFDECKIEWEPETEEERGLLKVNGFTKKTERMDMWAPRPMAYDLIARAMASADHAQDQEITLAFLRRGRHEYHAGNYIQAFYNYFLLPRNPVRRRLLVSASRQECFD